MMSAFFNLDLVRYNCDLLGTSTYAFLTPFKEPLR